MVRGACDPLFSRGSTATSNFCSVGKRLPDLCAKRARGVQESREAGPRRVRRPGSAGSEWEASTHDLWWSSKGHFLCSESHGEGWEADPGRAGYIQWSGSHVFGVCCPRQEEVASVDRRAANECRQREVVLDY